ncbi:uncharacterized protein LOC124098291 [Marmota monax]|uniref:uncharacterized protein LOC124098291 n=1 Tax=Marmota monax TaxID=9995 RepID=UPI0026EED95E|nr:uncharacterized protein LOC124098291 [Marmota monax]
MSGQRGGHNRPQPPRACLLVVAQDITPGQVRKVRGTCPTGGLLQALPLLFLHHRLQLPVAFSHVLVGVSQQRGWEPLREMPSGLHSWGEGPVPSSARAHTAQDSEAKDKFHVGGGWTGCSGVQGDCLALELQADQGVASPSPGDPPAAAAAPCSLQSFLRGWEPGGGPCPSRPGRAPAVTAPGSEAAQRAPSCHIVWFSSSGLQSQPCRTRMDLASADKHQGRRWQRPGGTPEPEHGRSPWPRQAWRVLLPEKGASSWPLRAEGDSSSLSVHSYCPGEERRLCRRVPTLPWAGGRHPSRELCPGGETEAETRQAPSGREGLPPGLSAGGASCHLMGCRPLPSPPAPSSVHPALFPEAPGASPLRGSSEAWPSAPSLLFVPPTKPIAALSPRLGEF